MKKKILRWAIVPMVAAIGFVGLNSFTEGDESSTAEGKWKPKTGKCKKTSGGKTTTGSDCTICDSGTAVTCYAGCITGGWSCE